MNRPTGSTWFEIWHDMNSCCQFWMDGVEIIVLQLGPGQCNCLQCRSKLNDTTTSETCHFELSKKHHVASNLTAAWLINLWLTGEWFHAREMISRCKPQGKSDRLVAYRLENDSTQGKWSHDAASHKADLSKLIHWLQIPTGSCRSLLHHPSSDALFRLTLDKWDSITLFGQINPNNCAPRMEIWFWNAVDKWIFQFPSPNVLILNFRPIKDVMAVGARCEGMRFVIFQFSISNMSKQKTTNNCHLSQEHSTSSNGHSLAHLWLTRRWSEFEVFSIVQDIVGPLRFQQQCRFWFCCHHGKPPRNSEVKLTWANDSDSVSMNHDESIAEISKNSILKWTPMHVTPWQIRHYEITVYKNKCLSKTYFSYFSLFFFLFLFISFFF